MSKNVRPSPLAGRWYPGQAAKLKTMVEDFLNAPLDNPIQPEKPVRGILSPHAGLVYSGPVAGTSMRFVKDLEVDLVVVIGPSHHYYPARLLSTQHTHYQTPLGNVPVALDLVQALSEQIELMPVKNDPEHAIEIELPFLQTVLPEGFHLLPLAMLDQSWEASLHLGEVLATLVKDRRVLFVASSDLSHFYTQAIAHSLDQVILDAVSAYNPREVIEADEEKRGFACGRGAIAAVMVALQQQGADNAVITGYGTSGDIQPMAEVVGYGAAIFS